ncbi:MAG: hypothetical protein GX045_04570 [Clostridiaceae bacterium]|jgi:hypothetical protein|nr:hypothetical protein [Clostridiaceae bacterium]
MTGVKIEFNCIPSSDIAEKRNLALASNDLPDLFLRANCDILGQKRLNLQYEKAS